MKIADALKPLLGNKAREIVDLYVEAHKAVDANERRMAFAAAGGEAAHMGMLASAKTALSKDEVAAYNNAVTCGDQPTRHQAIRDLWGRYEAETSRGGEG